MINFKVLIQCYTYNHASYIEDAMSGFCMQQTNFPFLCVIVDDASTDGEQDIIKNYLALNFINDDMLDINPSETKDAFFYYVRHKENENCFFLVVLLKYNHHNIHKNKGPYFEKWRKDIPYEAICEGDDFWIHPNKLQMQADILDFYPEIGLVYSSVHQYINEKKHYANDVGKKTSYVDFLYGEGNMRLLSVMYRIVIHNNYLQNIQNDKKWKLGDEPMMLYFIKFSKLYFIPEALGTYRIAGGSISHNFDGSYRDDFKLEVLKCRTYYARKYWRWTILVDMIKGFYKLENKNFRQVYKVIYYSSYVTNYVVNKYYEYKLQAKERVKSNQ